MKASRKNFSNQDYKKPNEKLKIEFKEIYEHKIWEQFGGGSGPGSAFEYKLTLFISRLF